MYLRQAQQNPLNQNKYYSNHKISQLYKQYSLLCSPLLIPKIAKYVHKMKVNSSLIIFLSKLKLYDQINIQKENLILKAAQKQLKIIQQKLSHQNQQKLHQILTSTETRPQQIFSHNLKQTKSKKDYNDTLNPKKHVILQGHQVMHEYVKIMNRRHSDLTEFIEHLEKANIKPETEKHIKVKIQKRISNATEKLLEFYKINNLQPSHLQKKRQQTEVKFNILKRKKPFIHQNILKTERKIKQKNVTHFFKESMQKIQQQKENLHANRKSQTQLFKKNKLAQRPFKIRQNSTKHPKDQKIQIPSQSPQKIISKQNPGRLNKSLRKESKRNSSLNMNGRLSHRGNKKINNVKQSRFLNKKKNKQSKNTRQEFFIDIEEDIKRNIIPGGHLNSRIHQNKETKDTEGVVSEKAFKEKRDQSAFAENKLYTHQFINDYETPPQKPTHIPPVIHKIEKSSRVSQSSSKSLQKQEKNKRKSSIFRQQRSSNLISSRSSFSSNSEKLIDYMSNNLRNGRNNRESSTNRKFYPNGKTSIMKKGRFGLLKRNIDDQDQLSMASRNSSKKLGSSKGRINSRRNGQSIAKEMGGMLQRVIQDTKVAEIIEQNQLKQSRKKYSQISDQSLPQRKFHRKRPTGSSIGSTSILDQYFKTQTRIPKSQFISTDRTHVANYSDLLKLQKSLQPIANYNQKKMYNRYSYDCMKDIENFQFLYKNGKFQFNHGFIIKKETDGDEPNRQKKAQTKRFMDKEHLRLNFMNFFKKSVQNISQPLQKGLDPKTWEDEALAEMLQV